MTTQEAPGSTVTPLRQDGQSHSVEDLAGLVNATGELSITDKSSTETVVEGTKIKVPPPAYEYEGSLPYSYSVEHSPTIPSDTNMETDIKTLKNVLTGSIPGLALRISIDSFSRKTASEMAVLRSQFRAKNIGTVLGPGLDEMLAAWDESDAFKLAFRGLVLGPLSFDLWLLQHVFAFNIAD